MSRGGPPRVLGIVLALVAGATTGGCAAAAPLVSAAITAAPFIGSRSVERTVGADMHVAWRAVETALTDMAFRIGRRDRAEAEWRLDATADDVTVHASVERVTSRLTRVTLRVETGGPLADRKTAEVIHDQVSKALEAAGRPPVDAAIGTTPGETLTSLEAEVRRLRIEIEDRRVGQPPAERTPADQAPGVRVEPSAIISVPAAAAWPSAPGHVPPTSVMEPVGATATPPGVPPAVTPAVVDERPAAASGRIAPARPADVLVPVRPVRAPGSGT
jgi:hypothetical protein